MDLHEHLRDLVAQQGPSVVESAEVFRAALDDFLTEDEATTGELNLLVDAVRLGAVERLGSILDHGGEPRGAVAEAGDAFARDRGTDDALRCRWAVAAVGYALGRLQAGDIPANGPVSTSGPAPLPPTAPPRPAAPATSPATSPATAPTPRTFPSTEDLAPPPPAPTPRTTSSPRRRGLLVLVVLLVAAVVAGAVLAGMWLGSRDDDPDGSADDDGSGQVTDDPAGGDPSGPTDGLLPEDAVVVPVTDDQDVTRIWSVDVETGEMEQLTDGPDDRVPVVSPDRSTLLYSELTASGGFRPMVMDLATGQARRLFVTPGGCDYAARPGFDPAGTRLALVCTDELGDYTAAYVVNLRGAHQANIPTSAEPQGTPTWTSGSTVVLVQLGATDADPTTLWEADVTRTEPRRLTDGSEGWDSHPDWSEEAGLLLFSRHEDAQPFGDLLTRDAAGNPGPSATGVLWGHPAWSPDGTRVVFTIKDGDGERLHVASIEDDGFSEPTPLADLPGELGVPAWGSR